MRQKNSMPDMNQKKSSAGKPIDSLLFLSIYVVCVTMFNSIILNQ